MTNRTIYIAEGYATAYSIYKVTSCRTIAAMSVGNLKVVAANFREAFPNATIVIAADNDASPNKPNIGLETARKLIKTVADAYVIPVLDQNPNMKCDFSDVYIHETEQTMTKQLNKRYAK